jgi:chromosome partitioning protein
MINEKYTINDITKLFRITKTKTSIYNDEKTGVIPSADRESRGSTSVRAWDIKDLPAIGEKLGFLDKNKSKKVITVYTPKGGVLKTTFCLNLARILALHNMKTLVIGLDVQCSITNNLLDDNNQIESLDEIQEYPGLFEISQINSSMKVEDIILGTDLPTLHFIPESSNLNFLEQTIRDSAKREFFISKILQPIKDYYDVIIFDNSPNWNFLIQNSLAMATDIISPISCDIETYRSLTKNIEMIDNYKKLMELNWNSFTLIPTKLERTKLSTQIEAQYRNTFTNIISNASIRSASIGQESSMVKKSVIEHDSKSSLADDYFYVISDIWKTINR